jgi:SpoVK/Ycf46/Vps4 family AAA+-type ATPase
VVANRSAVQIVGCHCRFNDLAGIWLFGASRTRIADCVMTNNAGSGVIVERNAVADFSDCTITENDGNGIIFREQAVGSIKDSKVEKNVADPYFNDGTAQVRFDGIQADLIPRSRMPQVGVGAVLTTAEAELNRLVGLAVVKSTVRKVRARVDVARGDIRKIDSLHSLFLGGPGTGKTTVALLMGRLLHELGVTKSPKVVMCERKDLVAQFLGQTAQRTQKKIDEAIGGVLFIDEAYTLVNRESGQDYGQEAIDTLLPEMERRKHELVVICAGYPDRMEDFVRSNPGLKERFRYRFYFEDFKPEELMRIFDDMLLEREVPIASEAREAVKQEFKIRYDSRGEGFANARMIRNFIADAHDNLALRLLEEKRVDVLLEKADVAPLCVSIPPEPQPVQVMLSELNKLVGLEQLKAQIASVVERINYERMIAEREYAQFEMPNLHALFLGSPGTGKTTVAKLMGEIYRGMGLLSRGHVIVISDRSQMIGQYIGQTAPLVAKRVREAFGGVLFIDEAYNLVIGENDLFGREALGVLNTEMENNRGKFVLIAAGYEHEMQTFLQVNTGFQSRFPDANHFYFDDYSPQELLQIFERMVYSKRYTLTPDALQCVLQEFTEGWGERGSGFSNGRAVRNYFEEVMSRVAQRGNRFPKETPLEILKAIIIDDVTGLPISRGNIGANLIRPQIGFRNAR